MAIGSSLGITLPSQGGNTGTWGTDLNTELQKVIDAVEAQVPASAIDFSADFDLNDFSLTSVKSVSFNEANVGTLRALYFNTSGELIVRDGSNQSVQMTLNGSVNTASNGGIGDSGGDYGTNSIVLDWDGAIYNAKNGAGANDYANIRMDELQLRDGSGNDLTIAVPAMSTNYTLTLPDAVPGGATTALQADTSGNAVWSNTFSTNITLSGSAELKHGNRVLTLNAISGLAFDGSGNYVEQNSLVGAYLGEWISTSAAQTLVFPIPLHVGDRIISVKYFFDGSDTGTKTMELRKKVASTDTDSTNASQTSASAANTNATVTGSSATIATGEAYWATFISGGSADKVFHIEITYDRP